MDLLEDESSSSSSMLGVSQNGAEAGEEDAGVAASSSSTAAAGPTADRAPAAAVRDVVGIDPQVTLPSMLLPLFLPLPLPLRRRLRLLHRRHRRRHRVLRLLDQYPLVVVVHPHAQRDLDGALPDDVFVQPVEYLAGRGERALAGSLRRDGGGAGRGRRRRGGRGAMARGGARRALAAAEVVVLVVLVVLVRRVRRRSPAGLVHRAARGRSRRAILAPGGRVVGLIGNLRSFAFGRCGGEND